MKYFEHLCDFDVKELEGQLDAQPELWNTHPERTSNDIFAGTSDIWVRFRDKRELRELQHYLEPHFAVYYPAWSSLPALRPIVRVLMALLGAEHLGGILITKIPPHGWIKPHSDRGCWHAEFYETKIYVPIKTNPLCVNRCEEEVMAMPRGQAWYFNNLVTHEVRNDGDTDRVTLIVCLRVEDQ